MKFKMLAAAIGLALSGAVSSVQAAPVPALQPATVIMSQQTDITSKVNGRTYRIQIATPFNPPPKGGYWVLYVLDGDAYFGTFATAARLRAMTNEIEPTVVVGIGYPDAQNNIERTLARRAYDLTQADDRTSGSSKINAAMTPGERLEYGHADDFLKIIETEIKPVVAAALPVNAGRSAIFGHSLGGLFVLHTLFTHPKSFQTYIAMSPSIWASDKLVLKDEPAFSRVVTAGEVAPRVFIGVGGEEQSISRYAMQPGITPAEQANEAVKDAMVDNARDLGARLSALKGPPGYVVKSNVYAGETHIRTPFASLNDVLTFAMSSPNP